MMTDMKHHSAMLPVLLVLTACGGGEATPAESTVPARASEAAVHLTCAKGAGVTGVDLAVEGTKVTVSWVGTPAVKAKETQLYSVMIFDGEGNHGHQLGKKLYTSGEAPTQFDFILADGQQKNIDAAGEGLTGLEFSEAANWDVATGLRASATVNVDGADIVECEKAK